MEEKIKGERLETDQFNENTSEHLHRYALAAELVQGKTVLDIACGEGYGSNLLSKSARHVTGIDLDPETVTKAAGKYRSPNLQFKAGNICAIPMQDQSVDIVISFETLEHHDQHDQMMREIKRVLSPTGFCLVSTPDKLVYSDRKNFKNPFHVKELYREEFRTLLSAHFQHHEFLQQQFISGSLILPEREAADNPAIYEGNYVNVKRNFQFEAEYLIAAASDAQLPRFSSSIFIDREYAGNKILEFQQHSKRYQLGNSILKPWAWLKSRVGPRSTTRQSPSD